MYAINEREFLAKTFTGVECELHAHPATSIRWTDAILWSNAANSAGGFRAAYTLEGSGVVWDPSADRYRLPTEAEWGQAAHGDTSGVRYGDLHEIAWTSDDEVDGPQPAGQKLPSTSGYTTCLGMVLGLTRSGTLWQLPHSQRRWVGRCRMERPAREGARCSS